MVNIYDSANQLASDLEKIDEYKALEEAIDGVKKNADSSALFKEMDKMQAQIMQAQAQGQDIGKDIQDEYKQLNEKVQKDPQILKLLQAEQGLYKTIDDVQKAITKPINDLYEGLRN
ncbi:YlbF family regulator [Lactobacillus sp. ESL0677]|uniref:YlbF family regulator n=1 Tax=Lactobacillus sp. ESL0677 TaxID=2983208 RepID=UPI0023F6D9B0|nr:YlbF family regulator [Lactobacillus sp. ESL0677]WEV36457.1 YlbF family regulator [Lactobacillus sp. ESL0677]